MEVFSAALDERLFVGALRNFSEGRVTQLVSGELHASGIFFGARVEISFRSGRRKFFLRACDGMSTQRNFC